MRCTWAHSLCVAAALWHARSVAEPLSTAFAGVTVVGSAGLAYLYNHAKCRWFECCDDDWIAADFGGLKRDLQRRVYGQHLVQSTVVRALQRHLTADARPHKPLVFAFHGWTGSGKNHVASMMAKNMYRQGMRSAFVHLFVSTVHFPVPSKVDEYKVELQEWIRSNVSRCGRSMFIFDEVDKMHGDLLEAIVPFLNYYDTLDGVDFSRAVYVFLSNTGGDEITAYTLRAHRDGRQRTDLSLPELERLIHGVAFNAEGGLQYSSLIKTHQIDHHVPFLPMQRDHVMQCVGDYIRERYGALSPLDSPANRRAVADMLEYAPADLRVFSASGCKKVAHKVELYLQQIEDEQGGREQEWG